MEQLPNHNSAMTSHLLDTREQVEVRQSISYIFLSLSKYYSKHFVNFQKIIRSPRIKNIVIAFAILILLFIFVNSILLPWYVNQGGNIEVPSVTGKNFEGAKKTLDSLGFETRKGDVRRDHEHQAGIVLIQNPSAGEHVKHGRRIYLTVSGEEQLVIVPMIKGKTLREAKFALEREGIKLGTIEYQPSEEFPVNTIMEQKKAPGTQVKNDEYISVVVSQGTLAQKVAAPNLSGKTLTEATSILTAAGLKVGNITYLPSTELLPNTIIEQFPRAGEMVSNGQPIDLFVVQGGEKKKDTIEY
jgi:hypothetical protein